MKRIITPQHLEEEESFERSLRPQKMADYVGQEKVKENLKILIQATKKRNEPADHILLYGPPGLGKTTLAYIIANEIGVNIKVTSGPAIERQGDLASILTNLNDKDIIFIDEIHRLPRVVEEVLYPALEEYAIDLIIGKGPSAKTLRLDLPKFTLIGATTKIGQLSSPLRDRFGVVHRLDFYSEEEIQTILRRSARILNIKIDKKGIEEIARRSRRTPRVANRLLKRVRDFAEVKNEGIVDQNIAKEALDMLEIDDKGLDKADRLILQTIIEKYNGGPVGLEAIAAAAAEDKETIEDVYEPFLLQIGFLNRTPKGRIVTPAAYKHLGIEKERTLWN